MQDSIIPPLFDSAVSISMYVLLLIIMVSGFIRFLKFDLRPDSVGGKLAMRRLSFLGGTAAALGMTGHYMNQQTAFSAIEAAGDISPSIVAHGFRLSETYPVLGFLTLALAFLFDYFDSSVRS